MIILVNKKASTIAHAETARNNYPADTDPAHDVGIFVGLWAALTTASNREALDYLSKAYGPEVVKDPLNEVVKNLLPNKTLQRVKRYLRREARKPVVLEESKYHGASVRLGKTLHTKSTRTNATSGTEWSQRLHCSNQPS